MRYRKLPQDVRQKIVEYHEHRYRRKFFNEEAILSSLSNGLKEVGWYTSIMWYVYTIIVHVYTCPYMYIQAAMINRLIALFCSQSSHTTVKS